MAKEIERKFLVNPSKISFEGSGDELKQGYLSITDSGLTRIRITSKQGFLTIKSKTIGISREEYEYEIGSIDALPQGAADTASCSCKPISFLTSGWPGKKGFKCFLTPMGPMPGPPPPWVRPAPPSVSPIGVAIRIPVALTFRLRWILYYDVPQRAPCRLPPFW